MQNNNWDLNMDAMVEYEKRKVIEENIEREKRHIKTIKNYILWYLEQFKHTRYNLEPKTVLNISKIMMGSRKDFLIFDNAGGMLFEISDKEVKEFVNYLERENKDMLLAYRIDGVDVIYNHKFLPSY